MKRSRLVFGCLALAAGLACRPKEEAQEIPQGPVDWSIDASADKSQVQVGEDLTLTVTVHHPAGGDPMGPPQKAFEPFDVLGEKEDKASPVETRFEYRLAAFRLPADLQIPALEFRRQNASGKASVLSTDPIPVHLVTSLTPDVKDIHDIKGPMDLEVPRDLRLLWWLLGALAAAALAYLLYRKLRREPEAVAVPLAPPPPPADVEAAAALSALAGKKLVENGEILLFYAELAEIVKRYAGRRFELPYLERTTDEMLFDLKARRIPSDVSTDVREILSSSDLAKFARSLPEPSRAEAALALAWKLVDKTRPRPESPPGEEHRVAEEVTA